MALLSLLALFGAMITLAIIPSPSVCVVVARSIISGFRPGAAIALGILLGDFFFILLALYGLAAIADRLDGVFVWINSLGALYLTGLGVMLWRADVNAVDVEARAEISWLANLLCGFLITISDPKAIIFYLSFFPAFVDLSMISILDIALILAITTIAVGGVKVGYAFLGNQSQNLLKNTQAKIMINRIAGTVMIVTGMTLVAKTLVAKT